VDSTIIVYIIALYFLFFTIFFITLIACFSLHTSWQICSN